MRDFRLQIADFRFTDGGATRRTNSIEIRQSKIDNSGGAVAVTGL